MRDYRIVLASLLALSLAACDGCGSEKAEGADEAEADEQAEAVEEAPAEPEEEEPELPDAPKLAFTVEGGELDGKTFDLEVSSSVGYWLFDPEGKNTMVAARGAQHGYDVYFYAAVPMKETGTYDFRAGASGADTRVQIRMRKDDSDDAFAYLASEGTLEFEQQEEDWLVSSFEGKFIRSEKMGADLKDMPEEERTYATMSDGQVAVEWKDRMGGKAARWN